MLRSWRGVERWRGELVYEVSMRRVWVGLERIWRGVAGCSCQRARG